MSYTSRLTVAEATIHMYVGISMSTWKIHKFDDNFTNQVYLQDIFSAQILVKASTGIKISIFLIEKWGRDEVVDHEMDL